MNSKSYAFFALVITAFTFAASTITFGQNRADHRTARVTNAGRSMTVGPVSAANQNAFQIGKDFAIAIDDSKTMKTDNASLNYTIVDLVYLIDELEGQAEATQLQSLLKAVIRGQKDKTLVSGEIAAISTTYLARLSAEQKWYFNVGTSQMNLLIAGWGKDRAATAIYMKELHGLSKNAPAGTPKIILDAINGLSKYALLNPFTVTDYGDMVEDAKIITTLVWA